ncbi:hypothetical protein [Streptomyces agglomeratus]|uniref:hypothetical protein n=1 Tax=Streptomyces agglomeratus TaxID=285458 RepID=UPI00114D27B0|nr:hypothetical protein [Streptomyces agglomeratus]
MAEQVDRKHGQLVLDLLLVPGVLLGVCGVSRGDSFPAQPQDERTAQVAQVAVGEASGVEEIASGTRARFAPGDALPGPG